MILTNLISNLNTSKIIGKIEIPINSITFDSRQVTKNSLFVAVKGTITDGHNFIYDASRSGAIAIICEELPFHLNENVTYIQVIDSSYALGIIASNFYDNPSSKLKLIGVTGTNGKTTIVTLLYNLFTQLGYKVGLISTVKNFVGNKEYHSTHTTPDPIQLNNLLQQMVTEGCTHCFMEVSSHAICQNRIAGLTFTGGVFTNITHDHLDYHKTFNDYLKAKKQFFDNLPATAFALSNIDDKNGKIILQNTKAYCYYYGINKIAEFKCRILENSFLGLLLNIDNIEVWTRLIGKFNAYNLLATYATAILLNENKDRILTIISNIKGAAGRFECVKNDSIIGIVDYAHTPDALENVLDTIDEINNKQNNIITVIGAGGNRDKTKRPLMAKIASEKSNKLILTSDNPRFEEPLSIIEDMQKGIDINNRNKTIVIVDRKEAIKTACNMANTGDIILIAGKGHENYQEINGVKTHFNDMELLKEFLNIK